jgi:hypothetical protein
MKATCDITRVPEHINLDRQIKIWILVDYTHERKGADMLVLWTAP